MTTAVTNRVPGPGDRSFTQWKEMFEALWENDSILWQEMMRAECKWSNNRDIDKFPSLTGKVESKHITIKVCAWKYTAIPIFFLLEESLRIINSTLLARRVKCQEHNEIANPPVHL